MPRPDYSTGTDVGHRPAHRRLAAGGCGGWSGDCRADQIQIRRRIFDELERAHVRVLTVDHHDPRLIGGTRIAEPRRAHEISRGCHCPVGRVNAGRPVAQPEISGRGILQLGVHGEIAVLSGLVGSPGVIDGARIPHIRIRDRDDIAAEIVDHSHLEIADDNAITHRQGPHMFQQPLPVVKHRTVDEVRRANAGRDAPVVGADHAVTDGH